MKIFLENNNESLNTLKQYVPIVSRVHGKLHPEIKDVEKVFNELLADGKNMLHILLLLSYQSHLH